jgi:hypothetical protein
LDGLLPESAPTGPLKTVTISRIGKATFDQVLASFEVILSCFGGSDLPSSIQELLIPMPVDATTSARACTEGSQLAHQAASFGGNVFPAQALWVQPARSHDLIGRTAISIGQRIVDEAFFRINSFAPAFTSLGLAQQLEVSSDSRLLTLKEVIGATVAGIGDNRPDELIGSIFMSLDERKQTSTFVDCSGSSLYRGDNLMGVIDHSMAL